MKNILLQNQEYPLIASPQLAKELGTAAATFLQNLHFLISETRKNKQKKKIILQFKIKLNLPAIVVHRIFYCQTINLAYMH